MKLAQDEIARIRKRKRGRNMLNRSGNTTDNLCFRYRFRDVFSRFRCCVYNGTGPLLRKHNGNMELHVSAMFPFTDSCNFVLCSTELVYSRESLSQSVGTRNPKVWDLISRGESKFPLSPTLVTRRKNAYTIFHSPTPFATYC